MKSIENIRQQLSSGKIELTQHASIRILERNISQKEIQEAGSNAAVIEDYPDDKYFPSCLLLGFTKEMRPLHIQVSRMDSENIRIITIYEPDHYEWINFSKRRK